jgi:D-serine deaminase-like pyridoxal phosphate-dependent protein
VSTQIVGESKWDLDTPALLVDIEALESNIQRMATFLEKAGVKWRPHTKGQKVPALAHKLLRAGAVGVTCAKLGEAEVLASGGVREILIANQVVGARKIARLVGLLAHADVMVAVDNVQNAEELSITASHAGRMLRVVVEIDIGAHRAGVDPGEAVVLLSRKLNELPGLRYMGLVAWESHCAAIVDPGEKRAACEEAIGRLTVSAELCRRAGLPVEIVSCGGTGTMYYSAKLPGVTEIQAGGGIFGDVLYESWGVNHELALTVLSTVTSRPTAKRIIVDAGRKAMSADIATPRPRNVEGVEVVKFSAEHGTIELREPNARPNVGEKIEWTVGYGDTTVFLHDEMIGVRKGRVECVWPILGRGKLT